MEGGFTVEELRALGDLAMQQHRYPEAFQLYSHILEAHPTDGDALHARGGALLEGGLWPEAHAVFRAAAALAPLHPGLLLHSKKELAYQAPEKGQEAEAGGAHAPSAIVCAASANAVAKAWSDGRTDQVLPSPHAVALPSSEELILQQRHAHLQQRHDDEVALPSSEELIPGRAFLTHGSLQVLSDLECDQGVRLAEDAAARSGGWTTARHYAVVRVYRPLHPSLPSPFFSFFVKCHLFCLVCFVCLRRRSLCLMCVSCVSHVCVYCTCNYCLPWDSRDAHMCMLT